MFRMQDIWLGKVIVLLRSLQGFIQYISRILMKWSDNSFKYYEMREYLGRFGAQICVRNRIMLYGPAQWQEFNLSAIRNICCNEELTDID